VMLVRIQSQEEIEAAEEQLARSRVSNVNYQHAEADPNASPEELLSLSAVERGAKQMPKVNSEPKVGRNEPCPCGSGRKYKQCHGKLS